MKQSISVRRRVADMFGAITVIAILSVPMAAHASEQTGPVSVLTVASSGAAGFVLSGATTPKPACATEGVWVIPEAYPDKAKAILSVILTAYSTGRNVKVMGTGTCDPVLTNRENVAWVTVQNP